MSAENVKSFFTRLEEDEKFRADFAKNEISSGNYDELLAAASDAGYSFTLEELNKARTEAANSELSESQLEKVSGGGDYAVCIHIGYGSWDEAIDLNDPHDSFEENTYGFCLGIGIKI